MRRSKGLIALTARRAFIALIVVQMGSAHLAETARAAALTASTPSKAIAVTIAPAVTNAFAAATESAASQALVVKASSV